MNAVALPTLTVAPSVRAVRRTSAAKKPVAARAVRNKIHGNPAAVFTEGLLRDIECETSVGDDPPRARESRERDRRIRGN